MNRFGVSEITKIWNQLKLQTGLSGRFEEFNTLLWSRHTKTARDMSTRGWDTPSQRPPEHHDSNLSSPSLIRFDQKNDLGSSLCCNTAAGSSLNRHLWYVHSVMSPELLTCEMSIATIVIKAKTTPDGGTLLAEILKSRFWFWWKCKLTSKH